MRTNCIHACVVLVFLLGERYSSVAKETESRAFCYYTCFSEKLDQQLSLASFNFYKTRKMLRFLALGELLSYLCRPWSSLNWSLFD